MRAPKKCLPRGLITSSYAVEENTAIALSKPLFINKKKRERSTFGAPKAGEEISKTNPFTIVDLTPKIR